MELKPDLLTLQVRDTVREFLELEAPITLVRAQEDSSAGYSTELHNRFGNLGYLTPSNVLHMVSIHRETGRTLAPMETIGGPVFVREILRAVPDHETLFPGLLEGIETGTILAVDAAFFLGRGGAIGGVTAERNTEGLILNGSIPFVPGGQNAHWALIGAKSSEGELRLLVNIETPGVTVSPQPAIRGGALAALRFENVMVPETSQLSLTKKYLSAEIKSLQLARIAVSAQQLGITEKIIEVTRRHLLTRRQFNRAIGAFQALQHQIVDAYADFKAAELAVLDAAWRANENIIDERSTHVAKILSAKAAYRAVHLAGHVFAGYGFMKAHDTQIYYRQAKYLDSAYGDVAFSERRVAELGYLPDYDEMLLQVSDG